MQDWLKIEKILTKQDAIGEELILKCCEHKDPTIIRNVEDFKEVHYGCSKYNFELPCGHTCSPVCNTAPQEGDSYICLYTCER